MSQLKVNERSVKGLVDSFKLYKDALADAEVTRHFFAILAKAKKFAKPELRQALEEFENKLNEASELGKENAGANARAAKARAVGRRRQKVIEEPILESDEEENDSDGSDDLSENEKENAQTLTEIPMKSTRTSRRTTRSRTGVSA
jgi:condensin complex subunit 1